MSGDPSRLFLCEFAGHLPNLQVPSHSHTVWNDSPLRGEALFFSAFPSITTLSLASCRLLSVSFLRALTSLPRLVALSNVEFTHTHSDQLTLERTTPRRKSVPALERLRVDMVDVDHAHCDPLLQWLLRSRSSLRELKFFTTSGSQDELLPALREIHVDRLRAVALGVVKLVILAYENIPMEAFTQLHSLTRCFLPGGNATATSVRANVLSLLSMTSSTLKCLKMRGLYTSEAFAMESRENLTSMFRGPCLNAGELKEVDSLLSDDRFKNLRVVNLTYLQVTKEQMEPSERRRIIADVESWMPQLRSR